ncbi:MAG: transcription elongation factor GreA [Clostridia bacterium]|nr:transcription elongation factor GreA [Clostridia bacterium]
MEQEKVYFTKRGYKQLQEKLEYLKSQGRKDAAARIAEARSFGDLSENAEYDAAKNEQGLMEEEINKLEDSLHNATFVDELIVKIKRLDGKRAGDEMEYHIVGTYEVDIKQRKISRESAVGKAIADGKVGETVSVTLPNGNLSRYKILERRVVDENE